MGFKWSRPLAEGTFSRNQIEVRVPSLDPDITLFGEEIEYAPTALTEIALDSGFSSHSHFTTLFRQKFGMTPSRYRRIP